MIQQASKAVEKRGYKLNMYAHPPAHACIHAERRTRSHVFPSAPPLTPGMHANIHTTFTHTHIHTHIHSHPPPPIPYSPLPTPHSPLSPRYASPWSPPAWMKEAVGGQQSMLLSATPNGEASTHRLQL